MLVKETVDLRISSIVRSGDITSAAKIERLKELFDERLQQERQKANEAEGKLENYLNGDYCNSNKCNVVVNLKKAKAGLKLALTDLNCDYDYDPLTNKKCHECHITNDCVYFKVKELVKELDVCQLI